MGRRIGVPGIVSPDRNKLFDVLRVNLSTGRIMSAPIIAAIMGPGSVGGVFINGI
jgi:hypothetical protein